MVDRNISFLRLSSVQLPDLSPEWRRERRSVLLWKELGEKSWCEAGLDKQRWQDHTLAYSPVHYSPVHYSPAGPLLYPGQGITVAGTMQPKNAPLTKGLTHYQKCARTRRKKNQNKPCKHLYLPAGTNHTSPHGSALPKVVQPFSAGLKNISPFFRQQRKGLKIIG